MLDCQTAGWVDTAVIASRGRQWEDERKEEREGERERGKRRGAVGTDSEKRPRGRRQQLHVCEGVFVQLPQNKRHT